MAMLVNFARIANLYVGFHLGTLDGYSFAKALGQILFHLSKVILH